MPTSLMLQGVLPFNRPVLCAAVSSMIHPSKELFDRQRGLLRHAGRRERANTPAHPDTSLMEYSDSTFFMRMAGGAMQSIGISNGDLLVVDRALPAQQGDIVIAVVAGEFCIKQLLATERGQVLRAGSSQVVEHQSLFEQGVAIWGVVRCTARRH